MEIVNIGTNTKNAEGIKISRGIKKLFEDYLKAKRELKETVKIKGEDEKITYDKITVEQLYVSYLATFEEDEDYKATMKAKKEKKDSNDKQRQKESEDKKNALRETLKAKGIDNNTVEELVKELTATKKKGKKKTEEKDAEKATE